MSERKMAKQKLREQSGRVWLVSDEEYIHIWFVCVWELCMKENLHRDIFAKEEWERLKREREKKQG